MYTERNYRYKYTEKKIRKINDGKDGNENPFIEDFEKEVSKALSPYFIYLLIDIQVNGGFLKREWHARYKRKQ